MTLKEIPRDQWVVFCDTFAREHAGEPATIEVLDGGAIQTVVRNMPLVDVEADLRDDRLHTVAVTAGDEPGRHLSHMIQSPERIKLQLSGSGEAQAVRIESQKGLTTLIRLPARPPVRDRIAKTAGAA